MVWADVQQSNNASAVNVQASVKFRGTFLVSGGQHDVYRTVLYKLDVYSVTAAYAPFTLTARVDAKNLERAIAAAKSILKDMGIKNAEIMSVEEAE